MPKKGARLAWVLHDQYLIVTGFSKQSEREVMLFKVGSNTVEKLHTEVLDVSPSILIPYYDQDSSTLFLTSKVIQILKITLNAIKYFLNTLLFS